MAFDWILIKQYGEDNFRLNNETYDYSLYPNAINFGDLPDIASKLDELIGTSLPISIDAKLDLLLDIKLAIKLAIVCLQEPITDLTLYEDYAPLIQNACTRLYARITELEQDVVDLTVIIDQLQTEIEALEQEMLNVVAKIDELNGEIITGTVIDKANAAIASKAAMKVSITAKGGVVGDVLSTFAQVINGLPTGNATWVLKDTAGNILDTGTIVAGQTGDVEAPDADYTLKNTAADILEVGNIKSDGAKDITAPDGTVNVKNSLGVVVDTVSVPSDASVDGIAPDATAVLKDTDGTILSTTPIPSNVSADVVAPDGNVNVKNTLGAVVDSGVIKSNETKDFDAPDGLANVTRDGVPYTSQNIPSGGSTTIDVISAATPVVGLPLMKTGQATSYRTGDDGDIEAGRAESFFILQYNNYFGHRQRFTGTTGGYYDQVAAGYKDVNGNATTQALAFPDSLIIDWSTFNISTGAFNEYQINVLLTNNITWDAAVDYCLAYTGGGYSDWRIVNIRELESLYYEEAVFMMGYAPFSDPIGVQIWSGTTLKVATTLAKLLIAGYGSHWTVKSNLSGRAFPVRTGNISELFY